MRGLRKFAIGLLCIGVLVLSCGCQSSMLLPTQPYHAGETQEPSAPSTPSSENQEEQAQEQEQPLPQAPNDGNENEENEEGNEQISVRFIFYDGTSISKQFDKGKVIQESDAPVFEKQTGYTYQWDFDGVALTQNADYTQTRYKNLCSAQEFLSVAHDEKYILQADIVLSDFTGIATFSGVIEGNGKRIIAENATQKLVEGFCGRLQNVTVQATFVGKQAPNGDYTAQGYALFGEITGDAQFVNCSFSVEYTAGASEQAPSAGLAQTLLNARFENCVLQTLAHENAHIYAVCVRKSPSIEYTGLTVQGDCLKAYNFCE